MAVATASVAMKEKSSKVTPKHKPLNTHEYSVKNSDSLASIALRFNTTPTELSRLNRLSCSMLFPGQTLFVPGQLETIKQEKEAEKSSRELITREPHIVISTERVRGQLHDVDSTLSPDHQIEQLLESDGLHSFGDEISEKYLKIKAKFITDGQGVVSGVVLITPQTFMFNPCVSDHLVIERGRDAYALRVPLRSLAHVSFFTDIAAMVTGERTEQIYPSLCKEHIDASAKDRPFSTMNDMSQTVDSAICQETGERISSDNETTTSITHDKSTTRATKFVEHLCKEPSNGEDRSSNGHCTPLSSSVLQSTLDKRDVSDTIPFTSMEDHLGGNTRDTGYSDHFRSDTVLSTTQSSLTDMEVDADISHSCPDLSRKADSSDLHIMRDSQSTSTPRKLPELIKAKGSDFLSPKAIDSPTHVTLAHSLVDSPFRVRKLTQNTDNLAHISNSKNVDWSRDHSKIPSIDSKDRNSHVARQRFYKLTPNESDSEDEKSQMPDVSRDSGISEGVSVNSSASHRAFNRASRKSSKKSNNKQTLSPRSSLSDEARLWLGSRGVRLGSESDSSDISLTETTDHFAEELLPRPAARYEDPPVYLCLKIHRGYWCPSRERSASIMGVPPNRDQLRREHWFALPKERVDQIYAFLASWSPNLDAKSEGSDDLSRRDDFLNGSREEGLKFVDDNFSCSPATLLGFEKISADEDSQDKLSIASSRTIRSVSDEDLPEMLDASDILTKRRISLLSRELPSRTVGHTWALVYSTAVHGISLRTLYRNMVDIDSPVLLTVVDEHSKVFGAFMSDAPRVSDGFYGTGESMLFTFMDENHLKVYHWSGENHFFIKGDTKSLSVGGGDGLFGLWLDEDLYHGRSHACKTFDNETLSFKEDFICSSLEAWAFV